MSVRAISQIASVEFLQRFLPGTSNLSKPIPACGSAILFSYLCSSQELISNIHNAGLKIGLPPPPKETVLNWEPH